MTDTDTPADAVVTLMGEDEQIDLVRTGWIRVTIDGQLYQLRRPLFGELKKLRLSLEDATDKITAEAEKVDAIAEQIMAEARAAAAEGIAGDGESSEAKSRRTRLKNRSREAGRKLTDMADDLRIGWWTLVFETLSISKPPAPAEWPSWVVDPNLPVRIMEHWRSAPLAPGR